MESEMLKKVEFEGVNILSLLGIEEMSENKNELDSILNELPQSLFFINGRIKVTIFENILLEHDIHIDFSNASFGSWTLINPFDMPLFRGFRNCYKCFTKKTDKTISLYGLFRLKQRDFRRNDGLYSWFKLQATDNAYMEYESKSGESMKKQLTQNFYCVIDEKNLSVDAETKELFPRSTVWYEHNNEYSSRLFFLEHDVVEMFEREGFAYACITPDQVIIDGDVVDEETKVAEPINSEGKEIHVKTEKSLLNIIGALVVLLQGERSRRFTSTSQLGEHLAEEYPAILGLSESGFGRKASLGLHSLLDMMEVKQPFDKDKIEVIKKLTKK